MLYNDWSKNPNTGSTLELSNLNETRANAFSVWMNIFDEYDFTVFVVLLNGPTCSNYLKYANDNFKYSQLHPDEIGDATNPILIHAKNTIDWFNDNGLLHMANFVLGCESPNLGEFSREEANALLKPINWYLKYISDNNPPSIPREAGTHQQSMGTDVPYWAAFYAYEFSWNPWDGDEKLDQIENEARTVMRVSTRPFHFFEYNVRIDGDIAKEEAAILYGLCPYFDGHYSDPPYDVCYGISGPTH